MKCMYARGRESVKKYEWVEGGEGGQNFRNICVNTMWRTPKVKQSWGLKVTIGGQQNILEYFAEFVE